MKIKDVHKLLNDSHYEEIKKVEGIEYRFLFFKSELLITEISVPNFSPTDFVRYINTILRENIRLKEVRFYNIIIEDELEQIHPYTIISLVTPLTTLTDKTTLTDNHLIHLYHIQEFLNRNNKSFD